MKKWFASRTDFRKDHVTPMAVPFYRERALNQIALSALKKYNISIINGEPKAIPIESIIEDCYNLSIEYVHLSEKGDKLGQMICSDGYTGVFDFEQDKYVPFRVEIGMMLIEANLASDPAQYGRYRFTLGHELGHWLLHQEMFWQTGVAAAMYDEDTDENSIEWQANYISKAILMPKGLITRAYYAMQLKGIKRIQQLDYMANLFEVSREAMKYCLSDFGLHI